MLIYCVAGHALWGEEWVNRAQTSYLLRCEPCGGRYNVNTCTVIVTQIMACQVGMNTCTVIYCVMDKYIIGRGRVTPIVTCGPETEENRGQYTS